ncbi:NUDIX domain-containing protein [Pelagibacterium sp. 26DY04]|uniref:isopentenyl-diphosphate Delta-isomerase n=1 Tax=Pelagibacterium sp. 26DY04 TaxID=2967130 RepID=UPI0028149A9A|nr:NUDIX domain-containing protein [Pelagibacterium sp. 26DY04]WMT85498.1 NUDIX domain-containing protein [Pelagibacterium sp. 26DY04]
MPAASQFDDALGELITGVDDEGTLYPIEKLKAHRTGVKHLAISVFLFQGDRLLLQQRSSLKYHAPLLWTNSACSHPRWQESSADCVTRTLGRELGVDFPARFVGRTEYDAPIGPLFENEVVDCYRGEIPPRFSFSDMNPSEVAGLRTAGRGEIEQDVATHPERYTPWFRIYVERGLVSALF